MSIKFAFLVSLACCLSLIGCGGGGGGGSGTPAAATPPAQQASSSASAAPTSSSSQSSSAGASSASASSISTVSTCPNAVQSDVWLDKRLGCLSVGQQLFLTVQAVTGAPDDVAFVARERATGENWTSILGMDVWRHYRHFLCLKNTPADFAIGSAFYPALQNDLGTVFGLGFATPGLPPGIILAQIQFRGGKYPSYTKMTCDPALHPVIADYNTGKIVSINPAALSVQEVYDMK